MQLLRRGLDSADDFVIAGAAAEVAGELEADFVLGGVRSLVEQGFGGDEEAGGANAALECSAFEEALLERMQVALLGQAFDGFDRRSFGFDAENDATVDRKAVHQHGASTAVAVVAAFLGPGEPQIFAEDFQQALPGLAEELGGFAVDGCGNVDFFGHGSGFRVRGSGFRKRERGRRLSAGCV